jgi:hypothetical protein
VEGSFAPREGIRAANATYPVEDDCVRPPTLTTAAAVAKPGVVPVRSGEGFMSIRARFFGAVALSLAALSPAHAIDYVAYRGALVTMIETTRDLRARAGADAPGTDAQLVRASQAYAALTNAQIDQIARALPEARLLAMAAQLDTMVASAANADKTIVPSAPDPSPAFCANYPPAVAYAALATKVIAMLVIKGLEYSCHEEVLGFNVAAGCIAPEIAATSAEIASQLSAFCTAQNRAASGRAVLYTERSVATHLDAMMDAELSTVATQAAADTASATTSASDSVVTDVSTRLDQQAVRTNATVARALGDLAGIADIVADIQSRGDDIVFRMRVVQADVEDVQIRADNLRDSQAEITASIEASRNSAQSLGVGTTALAPAIESAARALRRDEIAVALSDADGKPSGFALPSEAGGAIEEAREVLISALTALQGIGQGDTTQATAHLVAGDAHYSAGRYPDAWREFALAYRALDPHLGTGGVR